MLSVSLNKTFLSLSLLIYNAEMVETLFNNTTTNTTTNNNTNNDYDDDDDDDDDTIYILKRDPPPLCEHCQCILTVCHILVKCNNFSQ